MARLYLASEEIDTVSNCC